MRLNEQSKVWKNHESSCLHKIWVTGSSPTKKVFEDPK